MSAVGQDDGTAVDADSAFRRRLLDGLAEAIAADGLRATTVGEVVRRARTSRRTFYQHFADKEACYVALLTEANARMIREISAATDPAAPWTEQVRQAVEAWIGCAESMPALTLSWIRDVPALGAASRGLQRGMMDNFIAMVQSMCDAPEFRSRGIGPVSKETATVLLGGLRELIATTVEDGGRISDIAREAVHSAIALLRPRSGTADDGAE